MLERKEILSLEFYKKSPFHGSYKGIRYRIEKEESKEGDEEVRLKCTTWPEPYSFEATDEEQMEYYYASFDEEGLEDIVDHINTLSYTKN